MSFSHFCAFKIICTIENVNSVFSKQEEEGIVSQKLDFRTAEFQEVSTVQKPAESGA